MSSVTTEGIAGKLCRRCGAKQSRPYHSSTALDGTQARRKDGDWVGPAVRARCKWRSGCRGSPTYWIGI